jgi:hypothetical protein
MMSAPAHSGCVGGVAISAAEVVAKTLAISGDATPPFMPSAESARKAAMNKVHSVPWKAGIRCPLP